MRTVVLVIFPLLAVPIHLVASQGGTCGKRGAGDADGESSSCMPGDLKDSGGTSWLVDTEVPSVFVEAAANAQVAVLRRAHKSLGASLLTPKFLARIAKGKRLKDVKTVRPPYLDTFWTKSRPWSSWQTGQREPTKILSAVSVKEFFQPGADSDGPFLHYTNERKASFGDTLERIFEPLGDILQQVALSEATKRGLDGLRPELEGNPSVFLTQAGVSAAAHVDYRSNLHWILHGSKNWTVMEPANTTLAKIFPAPDSQWRQMSIPKSVQFQHSVDAAKLELQPGDLIFQPGMTPHFVETTADSIALTHDYTFCPDTRKLSGELQEELLGLGNCAMSSIVEHAVAGLPHKLSLELGLGHAAAVLFRSLTSFGTGPGGIEEAAKSWAARIALSIQTDANERPNDNCEAIKRSLSEASSRDKAGLVVKRITRNPRDNSFFMVVANMLRASQRVYTRTQSWGLLIDMVEMVGNRVLEAGNCKGPAAPGVLLDFTQAVADVASSHQQQKEQKQTAKKQKK